MIHVMEDRIPVCIYCLLHHEDDLMMCLGQALSASPIVTQRDGV